jgi:hypothetical protein
VRRVAVAVLAATTALGLVVLPSAAPQAGAAGLNPLTVRATDSARHTQSSRLTSALR